MTQYRDSHDELQSVQLITTPSDIKERFIDKHFQICDAFKDI